MSGASGSGPIDRLTEAFGRLERVMVRLEAALAVVSESEDRRLQATADELALLVDGALARIDRALKEEA